MLNMCCLPAFLHRESAREREREAGKQGTADEVLPGDWTTAVSLRYQSYGGGGPPKDLRKNSTFAFTFNQTFFLLPREHAN